MSSSSSAVVWATSFCSTTTSVSAALPAERTNDVGSSTWLAASFNTDTLSAVIPDSTTLATSAVELSVPTNGAV